MIKVVKISRSIIRTKIFEIIKIKYLKASPHKEKLEKLGKIQLFLSLRRLSTISPKERANVFNFNVFQHPFHYIVCIKHDTKL